MDSSFIKKKHSQAPAFTAFCLSKLNIFGSDKTRPLGPSMDIYFFWQSIYNMNQLIVKVINGWIDSENKPKRFYRWNILRVREWYVMVPSLLWLRQTQWLDHVCCRHVKFTVTLCPQGWRWAWSLSLALSPPCCRWSWAVCSSETWLLRAPFSLSWCLPKR